MSENTIILIIQAMVSGLMIGGIYALLSAGLTLTFGVLNILNLAHGEFTMAGMYAAYFAFTYLGIDPYLALIPAIPSFLIIGFIIERYMVELIIDAPHSIQILMTIGLSLVLQNLALFFWTANYRSVHPTYADLALHICGVGISVPRLIAFIASLFLSLLLYFGLQCTDIGKAVRACANDRDVASLCGINVRQIYGITFGLGCACAEHS